MASEIRVNRLSNRSGLSTITFANGGVQFSGITTFANGDFRVGTGATILNPSANEMQFHTGGSNRLTINNSGVNLGTGNITAVDATFSGNVSIGKTLTYEDVKNVDSVGVVTARTGIKITGGDFTVGTAITASSVTGNVTQDVGITTFSGSATWFKGTATNKDMYWSKSSGSLVFKDNAAALFGSSSDLQIYHSSSDNNSYIIEGGSGSLMIQGDIVNIGNVGSTKYYIRAFEDGAVQLRYAQNTKLATTSSGVEVTGGIKLNQSQSTINLDTSDGSDNKYISIHGGGSASQSRGAGISLYGNEVTNHQGRLQLLAGNSGNANGVIQMHTGGAERIRITSGGVAQFYSPDGASKGYIYQLNNDNFIVEADANDNTDGDLLLRAAADGGTIQMVCGGTNERLRITSGGNIGVAGATGTDFSLLDGMVVNVANGSAGLLINSSSSSHNAYLGFSYGSGSSTSHADQFSAYLGRVGDNQLVFGTNNVIRGQVSPTGGLQWGLPGSSSSLPGAHGALNVRALANGNLHVRASTDLQGGTTGVGLDILNDAGNTVQDLVIRGATTYFRNASGETLRIDSTGRLGLGVAPYASNTVSLSLKDGTNFWSSTPNNSYWGSNTYYNGSAWKYIANGIASTFRMENGILKYHTAVSGTAGNTATLNEWFRVTSAGNMIMGGTGNTFGGTLPLLELIKASTGTGPKITMYNGQASAADAECEIQIGHNYREAARVIFGRDNNSNWQSSAAAAEANMQIQLNHAGTMQDVLRINHQGVIKHKSVGWHSSTSGTTKYSWSRHGGTGGSTTDTVLCVLTNYTTSTTVMAKVTYCGLYGMAGGHTAIGILIASQRRANNGSAWSPKEGALNSAGNDSVADLTMWWDGDMLKIRHTAWMNWSVDCEVTVYNGGLTVN
jgi:hypothetical protein